MKIYKKTVNQSTYKLNDTPQKIKNNDTEKISNKVNITMSEIFQL